jgi:CubicO group peptidase (beta-lactamase class C family)
MRALCFLVPFLILGCSPAFCAESPATAEGHALAPVLQTMVDNHLVSGAVALVASPDKVMEVEAVGRASLKTGEPMRADSLFWIASMTKSMTATALMMLVDEGKVNIADPVEKYLPEFKEQLVAGNDQAPAHPPRRPITLRDILTHTSGLILAGDPLLRRDYSLASEVAQIAAQPLRQEPGTKYEYNNSGINTAGRIIEVVSGITYAEFMQRRLFEPLGMRDTTFWPSEEQAARLAHSSRRNPDTQDLEEVQFDTQVTPAVIEKLGHGVKVPQAMIADMGVGTVSEYATHYAMPAGGLYSTAHDLGAFGQMLLNGGQHHGQRLLSAAAVREMTSNQTGEVRVNPQEAYGLGYSVKIREDEGLSVGSFGHRGARRTAIWIDPVRRLAMVLLVERMDMSGAEQKQLYPPFLQTAVDAFGLHVP